ncbi:Alpha/Beta hydrolase protein [Ustulina deusta]|nr:Alpha/Beta hydrolase protein [Ustulina deusta]
MRITKDLDEETGNIVLQDVGEPGNLEVRGAVVFRGFYCNEKDTAEAFTHDGWFRTGDTGIIDSTGSLSLFGRIKDLVNINGIKVSGAELQTSLETAVGSQVLRLVSFASWAGHTEQVSIAYIPKQWPMKTEDMVNINDKLANVCLLLTRSRPLVFGLRDESILPKSSLGKISRAKMKSLLETGSFADQIEYHQSAIEGYRLKHISFPMTEEAARLLEDFASVLEIRPDKIGVDTPFYDFGITSIDIVRLKRKVDQRLSIDVPMVTLMNSPTVRALALAIDYSPLQNGDSVAKEYDPVVKFRSTGSKTPLWCIHPGVGEVLIFIGLAKHMVDDDRPIFALRARGFDAGQSRFKSITEAVETYKAAILKHQPYGPYALAGYSYGGMLAFEIAKSLEKEEGASVQFLASFNLPPNIKIRMQQLNFNVCLLHLSYFLGLVTEEYADSIEEQFRELPNAMVQLMGVADRSRMIELNLSEKKLAHWAEITFGLQSMAQEYEPGGKVKSMDVFHAIPLKAAAKSREDWLENYLKKWEDFSETEPRFYQVDGAHYTMIGPDHVASFAGTLKKALRARGL